MIRIITVRILTEQNHTQTYGTAVWQTQLRGRHANESLLEYMASGNFMSKLFTPEDTFYGQLGGCLEMIDCGTTTVADFAHINHSAEHSKSRSYPRRCSTAYWQQITRLFLPPFHQAFVPALGTVLTRDLPRPLLSRSTSMDSVGILCRP